MCKPGWRKHKHKQKGRKLQDSHKWSVYMYMLDLAASCQLCEIIVNKLATELFTTSLLVLFAF